MAGGVVCVPMFADFRVVAREDGHAACDRADAWMPRVDAAVDDGDADSLAGDWAEWWWRRGV